MKRSSIVFLFLAFFAISCAPKSQPNIVPFMVLGSTETPTPIVPTETPAPSNTMQVSYAYAFAAGTTEFVLVAEYDLPGEEDVLLPPNLDLEALKMVKGNLPVFNLIVELKGGANTSTEFTDMEGRYTKSLSSVETGAYLLGWTCTEIYTWELPDVNGNVQSRGGTLSCQKN